VRVAKTPTQKRTKFKNANLGASKNARWLSNICGALVELATFATSGLRGGERVRILTPGQAKGGWVAR